MDCFCSVCELIIEHYILIFTGILIDNNTVLFICECIRIPQIQTEQFHCPLLKIHSN